MVSAQASDRPLRAKSHMYDQEDGNSRHRLPVRACVFSVQLFAESLDSQKPPPLFHPTLFVIATTFCGCDYICWLDYHALHGNVHEDALHRSLTNSLDHSYLAIGGQ